MKSKKLPEKNRDLPATVGLVTEVRDELKAEIRSLEARVDAKFNVVEAKIDAVLVAVHRTQAIVEEQRGENRIMYETLKGFNQRMDRMEDRQDNQDETLQLLVRSRDK